MPKNSNASLSCLGRFPWIAFALAAIAVLAQADGGLGEHLAYDRTAVEAGEVWRLITGHVTHWSGDHLLWDVLMFVALGAIVENRNRTGFLVSLVASVAAISAVLWFFHPTIGHYRGLSGIDSALFTHAVVNLAIDARRAGRLLICHLSLLFVLGFTAKMAYELVAGNTLFVDSSDAGFVVLPSVHMIGGVMGGLCAGALLCRSQGVQVRVSHSPCAASHVGHNQSDVVVGNCTVEHRPTISNSKRLLTLRSFRLYPRPIRSIAQ